jgi:hypothetical protein
MMTEPAVAAAPSKEGSNMHPKRIWLLAINVVGGIAVLGSYAHGMATHPGTAGAVWGGVPGGLRPVYTVSMLLAALGYFAFTYFVFLRADPERIRIADRFGFGVFNALYALILVPSALWMPLTFAMLEAPADGLWWAIRLTLGLVGVGSLGLLAALLWLRPRAPARAYWMAVAGSLAFSWQTACLDAIVWPAFFPR